MNEYVIMLWRFWYRGGAWALVILGGLLALWPILRSIWLQRGDHATLLQERFRPLTRWLLLHRHGKALMGLSLTLIGLGLGIRFQLLSTPNIEWSFQHPKEFLIAHGVAVLAILLLPVFWNREASWVKSGDGRADAYFRDVPEEWGPEFVEEGQRYVDEQPVAELLVYRNPAKTARRLLSQDPRAQRFLTLLSLRWQTLSQHLFIVGPQGSGKTSTIYAPIMLTSTVPWVYQDSKAELPLRERFPDRPVWGLDVRGYETRSEIWNPLEEIRTPEDFDLIVDYIFPSNPKNANAWVRDMVRVLFAAILRSRKWASIQEIARTLRQTRLESFLERLDPIYRDTMAEPKSQVPVLQDLVVGLSRWETARVRSITEGASTVSLDDFIQKGGYVMNCEDSDALKAPVHVFWAMLLGRLRNRPEASSNLLLLMDEFGDCGRIPNIQRGLVLLRSKGVSLVAAIQNLGLLRDVYPQDWQAVLQGFGSRIWLARNLEDELRERLSKAIGKFTRRVAPASKNSKETEREADLMPLDAWGSWSEKRVAVGRLHGFTYWLPIPIPIPKTSLGARLPQGDPWGSSDAEARSAAQEAIQTAPWPEEAFILPPPLEGKNSRDLTSRQAPLHGREEDWL